MSGPTLVAFVATLVALLLAITAVMVWQEGRRRSFDSLPSYVIDEVLDFVEHRLDADTRRRVGREGIERIIDWEVRYLIRDGGDAVVAGGTDESVRYVIERIAQVHGVAYPPVDVRAVLALEAEYLATVGAVGDPVIEAEGET